MKIELKNVKINLTFSEETIMFRADLVIDGVVAGEADNDGRGGSTFYSAKTYDVKKQKSLSDAERERNKELIRKAEAFCKTLPPIEYGDFKIDMNLEHFIDELVNQEIKKKEDKKLEKKMETTLMWGKPKGNSYYQVKFKVPLAKIPLAQLQGVVDKYKKEFKQGDVFLNTNLEWLGVKL